jgi:hypothetical protein
MNEREQSFGAMAIVLAGLAIGLLILGLGFNPDPVEESQAPEVATATPTPSPTVDPEATPTTVPTATPTPSPTPDPGYLPPNEVKVLVANGTDIPGRAAIASDLLIGRFGYNALPRNVNRDLNQLPDTIYHLDGYDANAREVGDALGFDRSVLAPMPTDPPVDDIDDAHILVILGVLPPEPTAEPAQ